MSNRPFVHLHCHSHYSLLDGASRIPQLVGHVKKHGMNAVALTDHGNLYGALELYHECHNAGINPIIGYEAYVSPGHRTDREGKKRGESAFHLTLLAQNRQGFQNLIEMASLAYMEGYYHVPRIDKELLEGHSEGLICLSGCASAEFSKYILREEMDEAVELAQWFSKLFGNNFYIEIQNNGLQIQRDCMEGAIDIANKVGLPLVATSDAHYLEQGDAPAHDILLCINTGKKRDDTNRMRYGDGDGQMIDQFFVRPPEQMYELFPDHAEAVARSQEIADSCDIQIDFTQRYFPVYTPPANKTPEDYLREICEEGLRDRYGPKPPQEAIDRLDRELNTICTMGFASYFLITSDFVRFALDQDIPATARGSGVGAIVSYVLKLSHVDPLKYDLLFERFLDPNRAEAPDIDIDFCQERREEVINYVKEKYGEESVAQIATFGKMAARAAIKDVGRVLDMPLHQVNQLTSLIPDRLNVTLQEALDEVPDLTQLRDSDPLVREVLDVALALEGTYRTVGTHAAGVVIGDGPLMQYVPLQRVNRKGDNGNGKRGEAAITTQWTMGDLEKFGMLKMDFLGLRTLTLLANAVELIEKTRGKKIDLYKDIPLDDKPTYELLQRGDAKGVFQLESEGMRELLKRMKPDSIHDLIAVLALFRPGPLAGGMVDAYINCKHGIEQPEYAHPVMEEVLSETYGIMVYQEQIMRLLNRLGEIELASAYQCIKAISKKKYEIIEQRRVEFLDGAKKNGVTEEVAEDIWKKIVHFGGYGFNKSHTCAYAHVGYHTAYLKAHYTPEFMAALLSSEIEDNNKRGIMVEHIEDARRLGVEVLPPCVNASDAMFTVQDGKIVFGLTAIKGVGRAAAEEVSRAREETGPFRDIFDFCERVNFQVLKEAAIEKMIKAGALDRLGGHRAQLLHVLPRAIQGAQQKQEDKRLGQGSLFDSLPEEKEETPIEEALPSIPPWSEKEKLKQEKEVLDFYFSSHPLAEHSRELFRYSTHSIDQLPTVQPGQEVTLGGMLTRVQFRNTKKARNGNSRYLRCYLEDMNGEVECVMWPDALAAQSEEPKDDKICYVRGSIDARSTRQAPNLILSEIISQEEMRKQGCNEVWIRLRLHEHRPMVIDTLANVLQRSPGNCPVWVSIYDLTGKKTHLRLGSSFSVNPLALSVGELEEMLGTGSVKLIRSASGR